MEKRTKTSKCQSYTEVDKKFESIFGWINQIVAKQGKNISIEELEHLFFLWYLSLLFQTLSSPIPV